MNNRHIPKNIQLILSSLEKIVTLYLIGGPLIVATFAKEVELDDMMHKVPHIDKKIKKIRQSRVNPAHSIHSANKRMITKSKVIFSKKTKNITQDSKGKDIFVPNNLQKQIGNTNPLQSTSEIKQDMFKPDEVLSINISIPNTSNINQAQNKTRQSQLFNVNESADIKVQPVKVNKTKKTDEKKALTREKKIAPTPLGNIEPQKTLKPASHAMLDIANDSMNNGMVLPTGSALLGLKKAMIEANHSPVNSHEKGKNKKAVDGQLPKAVPVKENKTDKVTAKKATLSDQEKQATQFSNQFIVPKNSLKQNIETKPMEVKVITAGHQETKNEQPTNPKAKKKELLEELKAVAAKSTDAASVNKKQEEFVYQSMPVSVITTQSSPQVQFSGDICSYIGAAVQDDTRNGKNGDVHFGFAWADLAMEIAGATKGDVQYKYSANLEIVPASGISVSENYVELQSKYGTFQFGNLKGPDGTYCEGAECLLGGTGGIDGSFGDMYNSTAALPSSKQLAGYTKRATKLVYHTTRLLGFQGGIGFCPNPHHIGWDSLGGGSYGGSNSNDDGLFHNADIKRRMNVALGLNFNQSINDKVVCKAAVVGIKEQNSVKISLSDTDLGEGKWSNSSSYSIEREFPLKKEASYQVSGSIQYGNAEIAAGFIDNGKINLPQDRIVASAFKKWGLENGDSGKSWNIGGKYSIGCIDLGLAHHNTSRKVTGYQYAKNTITSFTVDCQIVSGIKIFAEINHINGSAPDTVEALYNEQGKPAKNKGTVVLIGSKLNF